MLIYNDYQSTQQILNVDNGTHEHVNELTLTYIDQVLPDSYHDHQPHHVDDHDKQNYDHDEHQGSQGSEYTIPTRRKRKVYPRETRI